MYSQWKKIFIISVLHFTAKSLFLGKKFPASEISLSLFLPPLSLRLFLSPLSFFPYPDSFLLVTRMSILNHFLFLLGLEVKPFLHLGFIPNFFIQSFSCYQKNLEVFFPQQQSHHFFPVQVLLRVRTFHYKK